MKKKPNGVLLTAILLTVSVSPCRRGLGARRMTTLATVTGDEDGVKADLEAWRTAAFFFNPLTDIRQ